MLSQSPPIQKYVLLRSRFNKCISNGSPNKQFHWILSVLKLWNSVLKVIQFLIEKFYAFQ